jgi:hypothetical protein
VSLRPDEQRVLEFLQPLRSIPPVVRQESRAPARRRHGEYVKLAAILVGTFALVALIAFLSHRSRPAPAQSGQHPSTLTYLSEGGIAEGIPGGNPPIHWIVPDDGVRSFAWSPDGTRVAYLSSNGAPPAICSFKIFDTASGRTRTLSTWVPHARTRVEGCGMQGGGQVAWTQDGKTVAYTLGIRLYWATLPVGFMHSVAWVSRGSGITTWSFDRIAYSCGGTTPDNVQWCAFHPGQPGQTELPATVRGSSLSWSAAAQRAAFITDTGLHVHVWTVSLHDWRPHLLYTQRRECCMTLAPQVAWSADGTHLIVSGAGTQIIDAVTGAARSLRWWTQIGVIDGRGQPVWRP